MQSESSSHSRWKARSAAIGPRSAWAVRPSAASEPTAVLDQAVRHHRLVPPTSPPPNALCFTPTKRYACNRSVAGRSLKLSQTEECFSREPFLMPAFLIGPVFAAMAAPRAAAVHAASRRPPRVCVWRVGKGSVVFSNQRPNPSVERTHNGEARLFAPSPTAAPLCAAHVKR